MISVALPVVQGLVLAGGGDPAPPGFTLITDTDGVPLLDTDGAYIWEPE